MRGRAVVLPLLAVLLCALPQGCGMSERQAQVAVQYTVAPPPQADTQYDALRAQNPDLAGWLCIEGTGLDYPVMHTPDEPEKYLRRNFRGEDDVFGVPFLDAACDVRDPSRGYFIYGHNTNDGTMFGLLKEYLKEDFRAAHPRIRFDTLQEQGEYELFAVFLSQVYYQTDDVFKYYQYASLDDEEKFARYVENVRALSVFDSGLTPAFGDTLLTLSTCSHHVENGRLAVVAVKRQ